MEGIARVDFRTQYGLWQEAEEKTKEEKRKVDKILFEVLEQWGWNPQTNFIDSISWDKNELAVTVAWVARGYSNSTDVLIPFSVIDAADRKAAAKDHKRRQEQENKQSERRKKLAQLEKLQAELAADS